MAVIQSLAGYVILVLGIVIGAFTGDLWLLCLGIVGGLILLSLSIIAESTQGMYHRMLGLPLTNNQLRTILQRSPKYVFESERFEVYPGNEPEYPLIRLDDACYVRAKLFYTYLKQTDFTYTFELPNHEPIVLDCAAVYHKGVDLFVYNEWVFVNLSKLNLDLRIYGNRASLDYKPTET